jgi:hypothetical protein
MSLHTHVGASRGGAGCRASVAAIEARAGRFALRRARTPLVVLMVAAVLVGCGDTRPARQPEGSLAFRTGSGPQSDNQTFTIPGPPFQHPGMLSPAHEPAWQSTWVETDQEHPLLRGASTGMTTGVGFLMIVPMAVTFWPAAVGIMVGSTAMGLLGVASADSTDVRMSPADRTVIAEATARLQPDRMFRASMGEALRRRAGSSMPVVVWHQALSAETGTDPLAQARQQGLDGVLDFAVDAIGLAAGEERDTFGIFLQARVRALDTRDGRLRYERVLAYGPGRAVEGLPWAEFHTLEFLAADRGRVFRQVASDAISRIARALAEDPQLPLAPLERSRNDHTQ